MKTVVIGFAGASLDSGYNQRWRKWRPTVSLCQHEEFLVDRLELLYGQAQRALAEQLSEDIRSVSPETETRLHLIDPSDPWDFEHVYASLHEFARNYKFDPAHERYLMHITTGTHVAQICMFLLTEARYFPAALLQSSPPKRDGLAGHYSIIDLDLSRYDQIARRFAREHQEGTDFLKFGIATCNAAFNETIDKIERVAVRSKAPVLLIGPTGAGKSMLASRLYALKKTRHQLQGEYVEVNCATLRGDAAMSTLFGHVKGAFTGAQSDRRGLLRKADGGLIFLDEIGELGLDEQAMLLKAIEEKKFFAMGADRETSSNFQLIAGTNRNLREAVQNARFREDLLARINLWTFHLPPLRERKEDIEPNIDFELDRHARQTSMNVRFNAEARKCYLSFVTSADAAWPGNFRELSASITRMATLADGGRIDTALVQDEIRRLKGDWRCNTPDVLENLLSPEQQISLDLFDRIQLSGVITVCKQARSLSDAGRQLFSVSRTKRRVVNDTDRLRKFLARFGLDWTRLVG